jgi:hypothetical protein
MVVAGAGGVDRHPDCRDDHHHHHLRGVAIVVRGAWVSYFNAVLDAQSQGVAPPPVNLTDLITVNNQLIVTVARMTTVRRPVSLYDLAVAANAPVPESLPADPPAPAWRPPPKRRSRSRHNGVKPPLRSTIKIRRPDRV